jgi:hypothetical protein
MRRSDTLRLLWGIAVLGLLFSGTAACAKSRVEEGGDMSSPLSLRSPLAPDTTLPPSTPGTGTLPPLTLEPDYGGARGVIVTYPAEWEGSELYVFFAPFFPGERSDEGIFVLEPSVHPQAKVGPGGTFQLGSIPPGQYVIVVGPDAQRSLAIHDGDQPRIFEITEGKVLEIGEIHLG